VKVRRIHSAITANGADLLSTHDLLSFAHEDFIEVGVNGIRGFHLLVFEKNMADDNQISPSHSHVASENYNAVGRGINGLAQVFVTSFEAVPVLPHMVFRPKAARSIISYRIGFSNGLIESIREARSGCIRGRSTHQSGHQAKKEKPECIFSEEPHRSNFNFARWALQLFRLLQLVERRQISYQFVEMSSVTFLGTGPGNVTAGRFQSSVLLEIERRRVLLDAGEPCGSQLLEIGISLADLDAVWITHAHSDHVGGLPLLLQASWLHGRKKPLPVGVPRHLSAPLRAWLDAVLLSSDVLSFPLEIFSWEVGTAIALNDMTVWPHPTRHLDGIRKRTGNLAIESFLFEILWAEKRFVYSGDLGSAEDLRRVLDKPMDLLICELAHFSPEELVAVLRGARIGTLCLTHVSTDLDESRGDLQMLFERELLGTDAVYLPDDGESIDL
jgi:ribonuclease BN (tRNA processing enzyme)